MDVEDEFQISTWLAGNQLRITNLMFVDTYSFISFQSANKSWQLNRTLVVLLSHRPSELRTDSTISVYVTKGLLIYMYYISQFSGNVKYRVGYFVMEERLLCFSLVSFEAMILHPPLWPCASCVFRLTKPYRLV